MPLSFRPTRPDAYVGDLRLVSSDPERPSVLVALQGAATGVWLDVGDTERDLGTHPLGCAGQAGVALRNLGNRDLILDDVVLDVLQGDGWQLLDPTVAHGPLPWTLEPYRPGVQRTEILLQVEYAPVDLTPGRAVLQVASLDPVHPRVEVELSGQAASVDRRRDTFQLPQREADVQIGAVVSDNGCVLGRDPLIDTSFSVSEASKAWSTMAEPDFELSAYGSNTENGFMVVEAALSAKNLGPRGAAAETGGLFTTMCGQTGRELLDDLGGPVAFAPAVPLTPSLTPVVPTLQVRVDGVQTDGWTWDADERRVRLDPPAPRGAEVELRYDAAVDCEA